MPYSFSKEIEINVKREDLHKIINSTFLDLRWKYKQLNDNYYKVSLGGIFTYGHNIFIKIKSDHTLFIESRLKIFGTADLGGNKENVLKFEDRLQTLIQNHYDDNFNNLKEEKPKNHFDKNLFLDNLNKLQKLFDADILTAEEFSNKKSDLIKKLENSEQIVNGEKFLISLIAFKQDNILSNDEIILIKKIIK